VAFFGTSSSVVTTTASTWSRELGLSPPTGKPRHHAFKFNSTRSPVSETGDRPHHWRYTATP
jgi:hypothetical protein